MKSDFVLKKSGMLTYLSIPEFEATGLVQHGFSTRLGGYSQPPYASLNLGLHVGDEKETVIKNRQSFGQVLGISWEKMVAAEQIHGDAIHIVTEADIGKGAADYATAIKATDALITDQSGIPLSTYYADCVPIFFLDPVTPAIGLAHAGWKGTVARIGAKTLRKMNEVYGSKAKNCLIAIGPSIGPCCYEVDEYVRNKFAEQSWQLEEIFKPEKQKWRLDLQKANRLALLEAGALPENIFISNYCTRCRTDLFFSYRAEEGKTGRMAAVIMLK